MTLKWYCFYQSHTGTTFIIDDNVDKYVLIQARSVEEANEFAEQAGVYFDGSCKGWDCACCGDRWHRHITDHAGTDIPNIFGQPIQIFSDSEEQKKDGVSKNYRMYPRSFFQNKS